VELAGEGLAAEDPALLIRLSDGLVLVLGLAARRLTAFAGELDVR